jgi:hypothetical protein
MISSTPSGVEWYMILQKNVVNMQKSGYKPDKCSILKKKVYFVVTFDFNGRGREIDGNLNAR